MTDAGTPLRGCRVLIADDDSFSRTIVTRMLSTLDAEAIIEATGGASALAALRDANQPLDLAIVDFRMPELNGLQLLKATRVGATAQERNLRMVMLTSSADYGLLGAAMALDVDAFLTKPVTLAAMAERLARVLEQWASMKPRSSYAAVDINSVAGRLLKSRGTIFKPQPAEPAPARKGVATKLYAAKAGMVLAESIYGPNRELVLAEDICLSERMIKRLIEVREILDIDTIYVVKGD